MISVYGDAQPVQVYLHIHHGEYVDPLWATSQFRLCHTLTYVFRPEVDAVRVIINHEDHREGGD